MGLSFTGLGLLPLPEVTAIGYAAPILVVIFAAMFLGEQVRAFRLSMVALGLAGVLVVLSPRLQVDPTTAERRRPWARSSCCSRRLRRAGAGLRAQDGPDRKHGGNRVLLLAHRHGHVASDAALGLGLAAAWVLALLVLAGLLGGVGQILLTSAYRTPMPR
jgi:drug/metabolite transporter (DMT)-like permease